MVNTRPGDTFSEKIYNHITANSTIPLCAHCEQNTVKFLGFNRGYAQFCSTKCLSNSEYRRNAIQKTCVEKYGVEHYSKTNEYKTKFKQTCTQKYGVVNPGQISDLKSQRARAKQLTFFNRLLDDVGQYATPLFLFEQYQQARKTMPWQCVKCETQFDSHVFNKIPKCPRCYPTAQYGGQSSIEKEIVEFIQQYYTGPILENVRSVITPKELDIYLPDLGLAIEVCGIYWHSDGRNTDQAYHQNKQFACEQLGVKLLTVLDIEWQQKRSAVEHILRYNLQAQFGEKISARKCVIRKISAADACVFVDTYHVQGAQRSSVHYGMYYQHQLVSVMSISKDRFSKNSAKFEIVRFCSSCNVRGAFSKFVSFVKKTHACDLVSYVDLRWGNGNSYEKAGFKLISTSKPGYWYYVNDRLYHRLSWSKKKLVALGHDSNKTEFEIMNSIGALRFWDCGVKKYEL